MEQKGLRAGHSRCHLTVTSTCETGLMVFKKCHTLTTIYKWFMCLLNYLCLGFSPGQCSTTTLHTTFTQSKVGHTKTTSFAMNCSGCTSEWRSEPGTAVPASCWHFFCYSTSWLWQTGEFSYHYLYYKNEDVKESQAWPKSSSSYWRMPTSEWKWLDFKGPCYQGLLLVSLSHV